MKKKLCFGLVLTALYLSSSAQLPRIEIIGPDTCAVVPIGQLRQANVKFVELDGCREENDSLSSQIRTYTDLSNNLRATIIDLKEANKLNESLLKDKQATIDLSDQQLKKEARKGRILRLERNGFAAAAVILIVKIAFFKNC